MPIIAQFSFVFFRMFLFKRAFLAVGATCEFLNPLLVKTFVEVLLEWPVCFCDTVVYSLRLVSAQGFVAVRIQQLVLLS